jgi:hypothetical protein
MARTLTIAKPLNRRRSPMIEVITDKAVLDRLVHLQAYLDEHREALDARCVGAMLATCWEHLSGNDAGMEARDLLNTVAATWNPPLLSLCVEQAPGEAVALIVHLEMNTLEAISQSRIRFESECA